MGLLKQPIQAIVEAKRCLYWEPNCQSSSVLLFIISFVAELRRLVCMNSNLTDFLFLLLYSTPGMLLKVWHSSCRRLNWLATRTRIIKPKNSILTLSCVTFSSFFIQHATHLTFRSPTQWSLMRLEFIGASLSGKMGNDKSMASMPSKFVSNNDFQPGETQTKQENCYTNLTTWLENTSEHDTSFHKIVGMVIGLFGNVGFQNIKTFSSNHWESSESSCLSLRSLKRPSDLVSDH